MVDSYIKQMKRENIELKEDINSLLDFIDEEYDYIPLFIEPFLKKYKKNDEMILF